MILLYSAEHGWLPVPTHPGISEDDPHVLMIQVDHLNVGAAIVATEHGRFMRLAPRVPGSGPSAGAGAAPQTPREVGQLAIPEEETDPEGAAADQPEAGGDA